MKTLMRSVALMALLTGGQAVQLQAAEAESNKVPAKPVAPKLERHQLDEWLAKPGKVVIVDLRRPDEHQTKGALPVFLSIQSAELEKYLEYIPRDRAVITVSNHASRADKAAALLLRRGFNVVGEVGVEDYEQQGGQLNRIEPPAPRSTAAAPAAH